MPRKPGPRVPHPRTAAQRDQADAWGHESIFTPKLQDTAPASSWWTTAKSREEFDRLAEQQRERMKASVFGKFKGVNVTDKE